MKLSTGRGKDEVGKRLRESQEFNAEYITFDVLIIQFELGVGREKGGDIYLDLFIYLFFACSNY